MVSLLLPIIYIAFISLGLPDSILGAAWPVMGKELGVPLSYAGIISMIIALGTIVSSLSSNAITKKLGTALVTAISVAMTALALLGFSVSPNFWILCALAVPYGLGAGAVDAALNNYVALHYKARHMSWLHCFWGVGASSGPYIMAFFLTKPQGYHGGYFSISMIQFALTAILFATLPLWKLKKEDENLKTDDLAKNDEKQESEKRNLVSVLKIKGVPFILFAFFGYSALETTTGLWAASYLAIFRGIDGQTAARFASFFYLGITCGRFLNGFVAEKAGDRNMIRIGLMAIFTGIAFVAIPLGTNCFSLAGLIVIGLGCAPVYPSIIHSTPFNFGKENSQAVIGVQMASAYTGSTFMPPLFGLLAGWIGLRFYPLFLAIFAVVILAGTEKLNKTCRK